MKQDRLQLRLHLRDLQKHLLPPMDYQTYTSLFDEILNHKSPDARYRDEKNVEYARLNQARMSRWQKTLELNGELVAAIKEIRKPQTWIVISEHWCGDSPPVLPFLERLAAQNPLITLDIQLRDRPPFLINSYLTNGTRSIPKLIVKDDAGHDLFTWGPRTAAAKKFRDELRNSGVDSQTVSTEVQNWYNRDKGEELQKELLLLLFRV